MIINTLKTKTEYLKQKTQNCIKSSILPFQNGSDDFCFLFYMFIEIYSTINIVISGGELGDADIDLTMVLDETFKELETRISIDHHFTAAELKEYWQGTFEASKNATQIVELAYQETVAV